MLNQQTLEKLRALRLHGMAESFRAQSEQAGITELSFEERVRAAGRSAVELETESRARAPAGQSQIAASGLGGGHRFPLSALSGPLSDPLHGPDQPTAGGQVA